MPLLFHTSIRQPKQRKQRKQNSFETTMATISISASLQIACNSNHVTKKQHSQTRPARSVGTKRVSSVVPLNVDAQKSFDILEQQERPSSSSSDVSKPKNAEKELNNDLDTESSPPKFIDSRWKKGTWDLNMFVKNGKMDWDDVIVAGECLVLYGITIQYFFRIL